MKIVALKIVLLCYFLGLNHTDVEIMPCFFPYEGVDYFAPTPFQNGIIFVSPGEDEDNENQLTSLYYAEFIEGTILSEPVKILVDSTAAWFHLGSGDYCEACGELYFTSNAKKRENDNVSYAAIYRAKIENYQLQDIERLVLDDGHYAVAHPALSADGLTMIVAGAKTGYFDLYEYTREHLQANWNLKRLLKELQSPAHEVSPYLVNDSTLIFASDQVNGVGGLDLYVSTRKDERWSVPQNLVAMNSEDDDFGYLEFDAFTGLFSSNREGQDQIFYFKKQE